MSNKNKLLMQCLKPLFVTSLLMAGVTLVFGQTRFQTTFGGEAREEVISDFSLPFLQNAEGNYITLGSTNGFGAGDFDLIVSETDSVGNLLWSKTYGGDSSDLHAGLSPVEDGYIISGSTESFDTLVQGYLVKIDKNGNEIWSKAYTGNQGSVVDNAKATSDGGILVIGNTGSRNLNSNDLHVMKLDSDGNLEWEQVIGTDNRDFIGWDFEEVADGYVIAGQIGAIGSNSDGMVLKISDGGNGTVQWIKQYAHNGLVAFKDLTLEGDHLHLTGLVENGGGAPLVVKTDRNGQLMWAKRVSKGLRAVNASVDENGQLTVYGLINTDPLGVGNDDFFLVEMDSSGQVLSSMSYGDEGSDNLAKGIQTRDGGHAMFGRSFESQGNSDFYLVKTNTSDSSGCQEEKEFASSARALSNLSVSPFPDSSFTFNSTLVNPATQVNAANLRNQKPCCDTPRARFHFTKTGNATYQFADSSEHAGTYHWDFGDDSTSTQPNPAHTYSTDGTYTVCLEVANQCTMDSVCQTIQTSTNIDGLEKAQLSFYPNPVKDQLSINWAGLAGKVKQMTIINSKGQSMHEQPVQQPVSKVNTANWPEGLYLVEVTTQKGKLTKKVMVR